MLSGDNNGSLGGGCNGGLGGGNNGGFGGGNGGGGDDPFASYRNAVRAFVDQNPSVFPEREDQRRDEMEHLFITTMDSALAVHRTRQQFFSART